MTKKKDSKKTVQKKPPIQEKKVQTTPQVTPYPQAGKRITEFESELDKQIAAGRAEETKRGPGRPRKDAQAAGPEIDIGPQLQLRVLDQMLRIPFSAWAESAGLKELKLTDREAADLAAATKELLDYYIPNLPPVLIMWSNFTIASLVILQPRFAKIQELKKQKKARQVQGQEGRPGQGGPVVPATNFPAEIKTEKI